MRSSEQNSKGNILVVDDDKFILRILRRYLELAGYAVQTAYDGMQAWKILENNSKGFDLLLTDLLMPNMTGMELLLKVRANSDYDNLPVIFQTSTSSREEIIEGIQAGIYHYLTKPYDEKILLAVVASAIENNRRQLNLKNTLVSNCFAFNLLQQAEFRLQTLEEAKNLTLLLAQLSCKPEKAITGLSELLLNAIEHGNLGISYREKTELITCGLWQQEIEERLQHANYKDKWVHVKLCRLPEETTFVITDQGNGFDPSNYLTLEPERALDVHGRGIALSRMLSFASLQYLGCGNQVIATLKA